RCRRTGQYSHLRARRRTRPALVSSRLFEDRRPGSRLRPAVDGTAWRGRASGCVHALRALARDETELTLSPHPAHSGTAAARAARRRSPPDPRCRRRALTVTEPTGRPGDGPAPIDSEHRQLDRKVLRGSAWTAAGYGTRQILAFSS